MNSDCENMKDQIADLVTGILPEAQVHELEQHLNKCATCRDYARALKDEDMLLTEFFAKIDTNITHQQERVLQAINRSGVSKQSETHLIRRTIMKNPITKLAVAAAVIITVVALGLFEFIDTGSSSGVVWAEVARKVEASRGVIVRCTETTSFLSNEDDYSIKYFSRTHSRTDSYKGEQITHSYYKDFDTKTYTGVYHKHKHYLSTTFTPSEQGFLEKHGDWMNAKYLVETMLSCEHRKLGQKTIEGVLCEGIETTDPGVLGPLPGSVSRLDVEMQLWVNAKTQYPVLFESKISVVAEGEAISSECIMDQFQWDVELDPSLFEPNIPPDYIDISP